MVNCYEMFPPGHPVSLSPELSALHLNVVTVLHADSVLLPAHCRRHQNLGKLHVVIPHFLSLAAGHHIRPQVVWVREGEDTVSREL